MKVMTGKRLDLYRTAVELFGIKSTIAQSLADLEELSTNAEITAIEEEIRRYIHDAEIKLGMFRSAASIFRINLSEAYIKGELNGHTREDGPSTKEGQPS